MQTKAEREEAVRQRMEALRGKRCECGHWQAAHWPDETNCHGRSSRCPCTGYKEATKP